MQRHFISLMGLILLLLGCGSTPGTNPPTSGVVISTDHTTYTPSDAIAVTVHNALSTPIYAMDTLSSCSILSLQYQVNAVWQPSHVAQCPQKRPARRVKIDAGATYTATITASYPGLKQLSFPVGSYQLMLIYTTSPSVIPTAENGATATSAIIQVQ
jgi:hypothetical protein